MTGWADFDGIDHFPTLVRGRSMASATVEEIGGNAMRVECYSIAISTADQMQLRGRSRFDFQETRIFVLR